jgi:hypothetical protein
MADDFKPGDRAQLRVTLGDRTPDSKVDVTFELYAKLPLIHAANSTPVRVASFGPITPPIEQVEKIVASLALGKMGPILVGIFKAVI